MRSFGTANPDKYELVISPIIEPASSSGKSGRNTPDEENVLKSALETHMSPSVMLERNRKFRATLLDIVKDEHDKFLLGLDPPLRVPKDKITRWHAEFDLDSCRNIERAELPEPPAQEKLSTAKDVLERANKLFNENSRMQKAIERLAEGHAKTTGNSGV